MALLTAAVGATGTALGLATLGHFACRPGSRAGEAEAAVSSDARAKVLGVAECLPAGSWTRADRHATLIGELLVLSRRPGSVDSSLQLGGTHVAVDDCTVKIVSLSGATLATFWLNSPVEAARWAKELDSSAWSLPKTLSINRRQVETIRSEQALWEGKIAKAKDSRKHRDRLLVEVAEKEREVAELNSEIQSFKDLPQTLSLDRHQIQELEQISRDKERQVAVLQGQLDAFQAMPKVLSLSRRQVAELEQRALAEEGRAADLRQELEAFQAQEKRLAVERARAAELRAQHGRKDGILDSLRSRVSHLAELPRMLSVRRAQVEEMEAERDARIAELERRLAQAAELPRMLSLNRRQAHDMVRQAAEREAELAALRRQVLHKRAQAMLKPRVISTTTSVHQGPAVVKEVVTKPFGTIPEEQPGGPGALGSSCDSTGAWVGA